MDITFKCPYCSQEMVADDSGAGSEVECPSCGKTITIPAPTSSQTSSQPLNPILTSAAAREEKHYSVPVREAHTEILIEKPKPPLEATAKGIDKQIRVKTIRRIDCMEVGKDRFDENVSQFLGKIGQENIISISPINYTYQDIGSRQLLTDFGVLIVYKG
jgi:DNA-directed RNA polymerase subunit M/transcription elongation factor TFIIS